MRMIVGAARLILAALMLCAVVATYAYVAERAGTIPNPFNFFGYFTIQSNLIGIVAIAGSAVMLLRGRPSTRWFAAFRGAAVAYLAIVGVVYAVLLAPLGLEGGVPVPWANTVLHIVSPIAGAADWILVADRPALPWRRLWVVLIYPAVWLGVVLVRGATDGWVPYPFLAPENGAAAITAVCVGIALAILAAGALATLFSRLRILFAATMVERQGAPSSAD